METKAKALKKKGKTLDELKTKYYGKAGSPKREEYESELRLELIGELIKQTREDNNMTQTQLGKKLGMGKAYVSRMENNVKTQRLDTIMKVFKALKAQLFIRVEAADGMKEVKLI
jgi:HTH-type transcriptional regulator/antitoxin HipB